MSEGTCFSVDHLSDTGRIFLALRFLPASSLWCLKLLPLVSPRGGQLIDAMMRGANRHEKEYVVKVDKEVTPAFLEAMSKGMYLKDLDANTRPCTCEMIGKFTFRIVLTQGLNRQIRRMCAALGYEVKSLKRLRVMNVNLGKLKPGEYRQVQGEELDTLLSLAGRKQ